MGGGKLYRQGPVDGGTEFYKRCRKGGKEGERSIEGGSQSSLASLPTIVVTSGQWDFRLFILLFLYVCALLRFLQCPSVTDITRN